MILTGEWNIGTTALTNASTNSYTSETATKYYAKVGLLSASDVGYAYGLTSITLNSSGIVNSWLKGKSFYTINSDGTNIISSDGTNLTTTSNTTSYGIKPSIYLSPTVSFIGGNGTSSKPYELSYLSREEIYDNVPLVNNFTDRISMEFEDSLTAADADGTRFFHGQVDNNYVWYSGKLWRIVSIDSEGQIKLITANSMAGVGYNYNQTSYSNSQVRNWLKNEFLPTINQDLIIETTWDHTVYASFPTQKLSSSNVVTDKVGLLTVYEYMMTGGTESQSTSNTFLGTSYAWIFNNQKTASGGMWYSDHYNYAKTSSDPTSRRGLRPTVVLRTDVTLLDDREGLGTKDSPYRFVGAVEKAQKDDKLNTRINGEYIRFNNVIYRIVGTETFNGKLLTKVTMADYSVNDNTIGTVAFGASTDERVFSPTYGIGLYLENWYQADSTSTTYASTYINDTYKAMIATASDGVVWYTGPSGGTNYDYTLSKTGTAVSATIGLSMYGELFTDQFGTGAKWANRNNVWLITIQGSSKLWDIYQAGGYQGPPPTDTCGVRPSFYLKSDVKIVSGLGLPSNPYEITM